MVDWSTFQLMEVGVTTETGLSARLNVVKEPKPGLENATTLLLPMVVQNVKEMNLKHKHALQIPRLVAVWWYTAFISTAYSDRNELLARQWLAELKFSVRTSWNKMILFQSAILIQKNGKHETTDWINMLCHDVKWAKSLRYFKWIRRQHVTQHSWPNNKIGLNLNQAKHSSGLKIKAEIIQYSPDSLAAANVS